MKINLRDMEEFVELNKLQEITSPILFQRGGVPDPKGLVSNEIFGVTTKSRKETFAYIDLHGHFFHPHIYKVIRRLFRNVDKIVNGELYYKIDEKGKLVQDDEGETGIEFLYNNWEKLDWSKDRGKTSGSAVERTNILHNFGKNIIFMKYQLVIPAFYRDIRSEKDAKGGETEDINNMYSKLIRLSSLLNNQSMFDFQFHNTNYNIQNTIVDIYDYFKRKLEKKNGIIRKYLMGKNVDYCTRTVITTPTFHANKPADMMVDFQHASIPIAQVCSLAYPFIIRYLKNFFELNVIDNANASIFYDPINDKVVGALVLDQPELYFSDKFIKKMVDTFIKDPESRFNKIEVPIKNTNHKYYLALSGMRMDSSTKAELAPIVNRPMTWTDLLFIAACDVVKNKHAKITRYPVNDEFGMFMTRIRVASTIKTVPMQINGQLYKFYPVVEEGLPPHEIGTRFIDSVAFSNSYLNGIGGDYDGDQTTITIIYSQEANDEIEKKIHDKAFFIDAGGSNIRCIGKEGLQTMYAMTKDPNENSKPLTAEEKKYFLELKPEDITFEKLVGWFADTKSIADKTHKQTKSKYNVTDYFNISHKDYPLVDSDTPIKTTLGRLLFNKIIVEGTGIDSITHYNNDVILARRFKDIDNLVGNALKEDKITTDTMIKYIDTRDWLGLQFHTVITTSFTPGVWKVPPSVVKLKKELMTKYKDDIAKGNTKVIEDIEQELIQATLKALEGDPGLDLYVSGARGSLGNHLKNMLLSRGAVKNPATKEFEIITNSLLDGLRKEDIATHTNVILSGAYPKAVGTAVGGYISKELIAGYQAEVLGDYGSDCGSKRYIVVDLNSVNIKDFMYRYVLTTKGLVMIDNDNKDNFIDKTVKMRSPMFCVGVGKNKCICNKCAGDFYYKMNKQSIGLTTLKLGTTMVNAGMKKFHDNVIKNHIIDVDDLLLPVTK